MESSPTPEPHSFQPQAPKKKGCGCLGTGCLVALVILVLIGGIGGFALYKFGSSAINDYTADHSVPVQIYPATDAQYQGIGSRLEAFQADLNSGQRGTLELSADDLNVLIAKNPQFTGLRGKLYFTIPNDLLTLDISAPLDEAPFLKGRYFNGKAILFLEIRSGQLTIRPRRVETPDRAIPDSIMEGFTPSFEEGFKKGLFKTPAAHDFVQRVQSLDVRDGKVIIVTGPSN